jgi:uroporphyrinogen-III synthase
MRALEGPLAGKTILVTRPKEQSSSLFSLIKNEGGIPLPFPVVTITGTSRIKPIKEFSQFDWIIFTSKNGVDYFFQMFKEEIMKPGNHKFAAVGEKTAQALISWGIDSVLIPDRFDAAALTELLRDQVKSGDKVLFPKGNLAPSYIKEELEGIADVEELVVYETKPSENLDWSVVHKADCFFYLSPSAVYFMTKHYESSQNSRIMNTPAFCIGPTTKKAAIEKGFQHVFMPERFTAEDMVKRAVSYFQGGS